VLLLFVRVAGALLLPLLRELAGTALLLLGCGLGAGVGGVVGVLVVGGVVGGVVGVVAGGVVVGSVVGDVVLHNGGCGGRGGDATIGPARGGVEDPAAGGGEALRGGGHVGHVEAMARLVGVGVGVPVGVLLEEAVEAIPGDAEGVDGVVELLVAALDEDGTARIVRANGVDAFAEAVEQFAHVAKGIDGGVRALVVEEREDAGLVLVGRAKAQRSQAVELVVQLLLGSAQAEEAALEVGCSAPEVVSVAVAHDEERAKLGVGDDGALLVGVVGAWLLFDGRRRLVLAA
jgi:hypothetical protein